MRAHERLRGQRRRRRGAYSYQLDENPASVHEKGTYEDRSWDLDIYNDEGAYAQNFNAATSPWCPAVAAQATEAAVPARRSPSPRLC